MTALAVVALAACMAAARPESGPVAGHGALVLDPAAGSPPSEPSGRAVRGVFEGPCAGAVLASVSRRDAVSPATRVDGPAFALAVPAEDAALRYGCDTDLDGVVPSADVRVVPLGRAASAVGLVLPLGGPPSEPRVEQLGERWVPAAVGAGPAGMEGAR